MKDDAQEKIVDTKDKVKEILPATSNEKVSDGKLDKVKEKMADAKEAFKELKEDAQEKVSDAKDKVKEILTGTSKEEEEKVEEKEDSGESESEWKQDPRYEVLTDVNMRNHNKETIRLIVGGSRL